MRLTPEQVKSFINAAGETIIKAEPVEFINHALEQLSAKGDYVNWLASQRKRGLEPIGDAGIYREPPVEKIVSLDLPGDLVAALRRGIRNPYYWGFAATDLISANRMPFVGEILHDTVEGAELELEKLRDATKLSLPKIEVEKSLLTIGDWIGAAVLIDNLREGYYKEALLKLVALKDPNILTAVKFLSISGAFSVEAQKFQKNNFKRIDVTVESGTSDLHNLISFAEKIGLRTSRTQQKVDVDEGKNIRS